MVDNEQNHDDPPLEPSSIAQFVEHDRCPRYLKQRVDPGEDPEARDWQEAFSLMNIALLGKGNEFEADQLGGLAAGAAQIIASDFEDRPKAGVSDVTVDVTWTDSLGGRTAQLTTAIEHAATLDTADDEVPYILLYQVPLGGPLGEFVGDDHTEYAGVPVQVFPSTIDTNGGDG